MRIEIEFKEPGANPEFNVVAPSIWIKVKYKGVTYGQQFVCSDAEENAIKEMIPYHLKEYLKQVFDRHTANRPSLFDEVKEDV